MSQSYSKPASSDPAAEAAPRPARSKWLAAVMPVVLIAACSELGISVLSNSALPIYFTTGLKIQASVYTLLMMPFFISEVLFKSPLGVLADKIGRRPLMLGGALVTVFTPLVLISIRYNPLAATAAITLLLFGLLRALDGLGQAAIWPSLYAYVGDVVEEKCRGAAMGLLNVVYMAGLSLSLLLGGLVDNAFGPIFTKEATVGSQLARLGGRLHRHHGAHLAALPPPPPISHQPEYYYPSFILASVLFGLAALAALAVRGRARPGAAPEALTADGHGESITWSGFVDALRTVPQFLGLAVVTFLGIGCIMLLVKKFALDEYGMTETAFGKYSLIPAGVIALISVPAGLLADRWGKTLSVRLGFALCALGLWGIPLLYHLEKIQALHTGILGFIGAATVLGVGFVMAFPAWLALLAELGGEKRRGTIFAAVSTAQGLGALGGVAASGLLYEKAGHIAPFVAAASLVTVGTLLAFAFVRPQALQKAEAALAEGEKSSGMSA